MPSEQELQANRHNARRTTGPRTSAPWDAASGPIDPHAFLKLLPCQNTVRCNPPPSARSFSRWIFRQPFERIIEEGSG